MTSPWGITPYGLGYYGAPPAQGTFYVYGTYPIGSRILRVELSQEPQHTSPIMDYDALNLRTWKVRRLDTNLDYTIYAVRPVYNYRIWDLYMHQDIAAYGIDSAVSPTSMRNLAGGIITDNPSMPYSIPDMPHWLPFTGTTAPARAPRARAAQYDLRMNENGTFVTDSSGDYAKSSGGDLLRKLIMRRLLTGTGAFFFLPGYGLGFKTKEPLKTVDLIKLQAEVSRQLRQEPEISAAEVGITLGTDGVLTLLVKARLYSTSDTASVSVPIRQSTGD